MTMINAFSRDGLAALPASDRDLIARREKVLGPAYRLFYEKPVHFVRGEGIHLYDHEGNAYLDAYNNVVSVGHCHPHVVAAITRQASTLSTHTRYLHEDIIAYAERLTATMPAPLSQMMFTCTGSEANDLAYRIARHVTGATGVIVTSLAYHGVTCAVSEFSPSLGAGTPLGAHVRTVPPPDFYRHPAADAGAAFAAGVARAIGSLKQAGLRPAMLLVDTIFSSDGVYADPPGFLRDVADLIRAEGGLFVADEVQPGFGRTGDQFWGFLRHGLVPDMVTMGKPMGNGYPVAGLVARPDLLADFGARSRYFNTFGGNPVAIAAARATLDVIEEEGLQANAAATGQLLRAGFRDLARLHPQIGDVRGAGLFIGVEMVRDPQTREPAPELASRLVNGLRERRILISAAGPFANVLKIRPPLVFSAGNAQELLTAVRSCLA